MKKAQALLSTAIAGVVVFVLTGCVSPCRDFSFRQVAPGMFVGCRPRTEHDFDRLRQLGIRTIISYETFTWHVAPEQRKAERNNIDFRNVPIFASPFGPSERRMKEALCVLSDTSLRPVYVHCLYGRDRTAVILALYRVYYEGISAEEAWRQMMNAGFKADWSLWGFRRYFWRHTRKPDWFGVPAVSPLQDKRTAHPKGRTNSSRKLQTSLRAVP